MLSLTLSVVVPTLNSPWLEKTLAALKMQSYDATKVEVIVVGLAESEVIAKHQFVKYIDTGVPKPPAFSRNKGLFVAQGDIVCFLDDDCMPEPDWLAQLAQTYTTTDVNIVGGGIIFPKTGYWVQCDALAGAYEYLHFRPAGYRKQLPSMNFSGRRQVLWQMNGFDEQYPVASGEDAELCIRLVQAGYTIIFQPMALIHHLGWRGTVKSMWYHIFQYGQFTPWINPELADIMHPPFFFKHKWLFLLVIPALALWISVRIFLRSKFLWRYIYLLPGVYLAQIAWGLGVVGQIGKSMH